MVDLEIPFLLLMGFQTDRLILHSLTGAIILTVPIAYILYPLVNEISKALKIYSKNRPDSKVSLVIGSVSHVLLDTLNHDNNPLLFPFVNQPYIGLILFTDLITANIVMNILLGSITLTMFMVSLIQTESLPDALSRMLGKNK